MIMEEQRAEGQQLENDLKVGSWMNSIPAFIVENDCLDVAAYKMADMKLDFLPVVNREGNPLGIATAAMLLENIYDGKDGKSLIGQIVAHNPIVHKEDSLLELADREPSCYSVVNEENVFVGLITTREIMRGLSRYFDRYKDMEHSAEVLKVILERAYEGVAVVDRDGVIKEFNNAYSKFTGIPIEKAVGQHVSDVIDNTNLHNTVKTGLPERGVIQTIQGQPMIVHRIPIWKDSRIAGAIGMLIFKGVSEVYSIFERLQESSIEQPVKNEKPVGTMNNNNIITIDRIIGDSEATSALKRLARKVARTNTTLLITGESGTGKELVAKGIHHASPRARGPFVSLNCGAIPEALFESELFGYEEGAFTGARKGGKPGKFTMAQDGTLFLDEIGEMPLLMQSKLLRALQEKEVERVGGIEKVEFNARIIAATNRNLKEMVKKGEFREDLYYRINVIELPVSPLRERKEDIPTLVSHYLGEICSRHGLSLKTLTSEVMAIFINYRWPGNIRELVNILEKLAVLTEGHTITISDIPSELFRNGNDTIKRGLLDKPVKISEVKEIGTMREKELIQEALQLADGNKTLTARYLGIHRTTLYQKLKKYNLR